MPQTLDTAENRGNVSKYIFEQIGKGELTETQRINLKNLQQAIRDFEEPLFIPETKNIIEWCENAQEKAVERMTELDEQNRNNSER